MLGTIRLRHLSAESLEDRNYLTATLVGDFTPGPESSEIGAVAVTDDGTVEQYSPPSILQFCESTIQAILRRSVSHRSY